MLLDQEPESEDEIANAENIRPFPGPAAAAAQALRHACLCRLAKQNLSSIRKVFKTFAALATSSKVAEKRKQWKALQELPGIKGSGYALKKFSPAIA